MFKKILVAKGYRANVGEINGKPFRTVYLSCEVNDEYTVGDYGEAYKLAKDCEFLNFDKLEDIYKKEVVLYLNKGQYGISVGAIYCRE